MNCTRCGEALGDEETESPRLDTDGEPICDDCFQEFFESYCPVCYDYYETENDESTIFLLFEDVGVPPGIYRPKSYPFYSQPIVGEGDIHDSAVEFIGSIDLAPAHVEDESGYPATFLCKNCEERLLETIESDAITRLIREFNMEGNDGGHTKNHYWAL